MKVCSVEGCDRILFVKGLCKSCYQKQMVRSKKKYCMICSDELIVGENCGNMSKYCNKCAKEVKCEIDKKRNQQKTREKKKYCRQCGDELIIGGNCKHRYIYCNECGKEMRLKRSRDYYNYYKGELTPIRRERTAWIKSLNPNKFLELVGYYDK